MSAHTLAKKLGWSHADADPFNAKLFLKRVIEPSLKDLEEFAHLIGFRVVMDEPKRTAGRGRPLADLTFRVEPVVDLYAHTGTSLARSQKIILPKAVRDFISLSDHTHPDHCLPSMPVFQAGFRKYLLTDGELLKTAQEKKYRLSSMPMALDAAWRAALDLAFTDPDERISNTINGFAVIDAISDTRFGGIDALFLKWVVDHPTTLVRGAARRKQFVPKVARSVPDQKVFVSYVYDRFNSIMDFIESQGEAGDYANEINCLEHVFERIVEASPPETNLGSFAPAMKLMIKGHPVRQIMTLKTLHRAIWSADFTKLQAIAKSIHANKDKLKLHPRTGLPVDPKKGQLSLLDRMSANLQLQG